MARWSGFTNGSSNEGLETVGRHKDNEGVLNVAHVVADELDNDDVKLECLFHKLLTVCIEENNSSGIVRPLPVMLDDGQSLDLYKLFFLVKERGGFALVSEKGLWGLVTEELGLDAKLLASVKLVYDKYLNEFERWLRKTYGGKDFKSGNQGCHVDFKPVPLELVKEFTDLLGGDGELKEDVSVQLLSCEMTSNDLVNHKSEMNSLDNGNQPPISMDVDSIVGDANVKCCNGVEDDLHSLNSDVPLKELISSRKRKRDALSSMLNWIRKTAKNPLEPSVKLIPEASKWKECKGQDFGVQILRAREALLQLRSSDKPNGGPSSLQV